MNWLTEMLLKSAAIAILPFILSCFWVLTISPEFEPKTTVMWLGITYVTVTVIFFAIPIILEFSNPSHSFTVRSGKVGSIISPCGKVIDIKDVGHYSTQKWNKVVVTRRFYQ